MFSKYPRPSKRRRVYKARSARSQGYPVSGSRGSRSGYRRNVELKTISTNFTVDPNTTGAVLHMTGIAQGLDVDERIGNQITVRRLVIKGSVIANATPASTKIRMMIVRDNSGNTTPPTIANLFTVVGDMFANKPRRGDAQSQARFTVLWDWFSITSSDTNSEGVWFDRTIKLNSRVRYDDTTASDEGKGALYLFSSSSEGTNDPIVAAACQVFYTDS